MIPLETLLFYCFSGGLIASALAMILQRSTVYSSLLLSLTFFQAALLLFLMGASYLAVLLLIVYMGAVAVLILFAVMLTDQRTEMATKQSDSFPQTAFGLVLVALSALELLSLLFLSPKEGAKEGLAAQGGNLSIESIGNVLYTDYIVAFELSGFLLLIGLVAALYIGLPLVEKTKTPKDADKEHYSTRKPEVRWVDLKQWLKGEDS